jgi:hypothetical protein
MIDSYEVVARIAESFGVETVPPPTTRATLDGLKKVGIVEVADCPQPGVTSWATVAASFFPSSHQTSDGRPVCVEFVAGIDARWRFVGDAVASCAFQINESNDVGPGTVYRNAISNLFPQTTTPHLLAVPPFLWNDFESYSDEDAYVTWLQLVPVTEAEAAYCLAQGFDALEEIFFQEQPEFYSLERSSVLIPG